VLWTFQYFSSVISIQSQPSGFGHCSVFLVFLGGWASFVGIKLQFWALYLLSLCSQVGFACFLGIM
ncbi:1751_t:CDS:2, partial [Dentiscutata heterogama]